MREQTQGPNIDYHDRYAHKLSVAIQQNLNEAEARIGKVFHEEMEAFRERTADMDPAWRQEADRVFAWNLRERMGKL